MAIASPSPRAARTSREYRALADLLAPADVALDGERVVLEAACELELRCGPARIVLTRDGEVIVRGVNITSRAAASHRIRGASVQIN